MTEINVFELSHPKARILTKDDVWGKHEDREDNGMRVAKHDEKCPVWKRKINFGSSTLIVPQNKAHLIEEVSYWVEYVNGADCISKIKTLKDGSIAIRTDYQAW